jgi:hypothetical protein
MTVRHEIALEYVPRESTTTYASTNLAEIVLPPLSGCFLYSAPRLPAVSSYRLLVLLKPPPLKAPT